MAIIRPVVIAVICFGLLFEYTMLPKAVALNFNRNRMDDQRVHKISNDMLQSARDQENFLRRMAVYGPEIEPEQQAVIRDEGIDEDMDYFFETLTKKGGSVSKFENQALPGYSCEYMIVVEDYGAEVFPRKVNEKKCRSDQSSTCPPPFECQEMLYEVPFLRKTPKNENESVLKNIEMFSGLVPSRLQLNWYAEYRNVSVGCRCSKIYTSAE